MADKSDTEREQAFLDLKERIDSHGGVLSVRMGDLRDAYGAKSLGTNNIISIQSYLDENGIGYSPDELPTNGTKKVRLYTLVSRFNDTLKKYSGNISERDDAAVRESFTCASLYDTIKKIRKLLDSE